MNPHIRFVEPTDRQTDSFSIAIADLVLCADTLAAVAKIYYDLIYHGVRHEIGIFTGQFYKTNVHNVQINQRQQKVRKLQTAEFFTNMHCEGHVVPSVSCGIFQMTAECVPNFYINLSILARAIKYIKERPSYILPLPLKLLYKM